MNVLVINAGSSSLKYQLIDTDGDKLLAKGICEQIGDANSSFTHKVPDDAGKNIKDLPCPIPDHGAAIQLVLDTLVDAEHGVIASTDEIGAVGHRVLHGGEKFSGSVLVTEDVKAAIRECFKFGPLHNPANLKGIEACEKIMNVPQVAVFDTGFHQTMPDYAYMYALPYELYEKEGIRRYGFHGTSHRYVSHRCCELLGKPDGEGTKIITLHLGNGSSIAALRDGHVVDTTMGLTPLDGFMMGTRSGAIDPSVVTFIMEKEHFSPSEMDVVLNKKSGMLGISGISSDDRDIDAAVKAGNERAKLAWDMRTYEIIKYVGGYIAALGGVDALVFTAGIGENQDALRAEILNAFAFMGVKLDVEANKVHGEEKEITTPDSKIRAFVIPTNEELVIARDTKAIVEAL